MWLKAELAKNEYFPLSTLIENISCQMLISCYFFFFLAMSCTLQPFFYFVYLILSA